MPVWFWIVISACLVASWIGIFLFSISNIKRAEREEEFQAWKKERGL